MAAVGSGSASARTAERILKIAQSDHCYEWLFGDAAGARLSERMFGGVTRSPPAAAKPEWHGAALVADCSNESESRLSYVPTQAEMNAAVIVDADFTSLSPNLCAVYFPQGQVGRFVLGTMFTNACVLPLKPGVTAWPAYRFVGFRMRAGYGYLCVGHDSDGLPITLLSRSLNSGKVAMDQYHNLRYHGTRVAFDLRVSIQPADRSVDAADHVDSNVSGSPPETRAEALESVGACEPLCSSARAQEWRHKAGALFSDAQLAEPVTWAVWAQSLIESRNRMRVNSPLFFISIRTGQDEELFSKKAPFALGAVTGSHYPEFPKLKALFLDRVSRISAPQRSVPLGLYQLLGIDWISAESFWNGADLGSQYTLEELMNVLDSSHSSNDADTVHGIEPESIIRNVDRSPNAHSQTQRCGECGRGFSRPSELRQHLRSDHKRARTHECKHCGKVFTQSSHLLTHVRSVHELRADFVCASCHRKFGVRSNLNKHVRRMQGRCSRGETCPTSFFVAASISSECAEGGESEAQHSSLLEKS
ncbi:PR domain zinc finger protein 16 [Porphyridium purpureum]|uniref:PR domain zinc finger protein 16 n=1 Tax=Porphyridium purpureum TaxID=35688 RepID=A0A5J4Z703_PORPP|nr:PR domain zinc finger protein 16 [Porphyridium purpureum]|eukprot:POR9521..scf295_1